MASYSRVVMSGSTNLLNVTFPYLDRTHVHVLLDDVEVGPSGFTWQSDSQIALTAGNPPSGTVGEVRRVTPVEPITTFVPGNLDVTDLNVAALQPLYLAEEARDRANDYGRRGWVTANLGDGGTIAKGTLGQLAQFDADGNIVPTSTIPDPSTGEGLMLASVYDPQSLGRDVFERDSHGIFESVSEAQAATIRESLTSIVVIGKGPYSSTDNGSEDTITSADGRVWYRVADVSEERLSPELAAKLQPIPSRNFFLGTFFQSNENTLVDLYSTVDLRFLTRINNARIPSGPKRLMLGRDPSFMFAGGKYYIPVTLAGVVDGVDQGPDPDHKDVLVYRSPDLKTFEPINITFGPTQVRGPNPFQGGFRDAWHVWCSGMWRIDGEIWLMALVSYYPDFMDINGNMALGMQTFFARCLDIETLSFDVPVKFVLGTAGTDFYLDPKVYEVNGEYWVFPKNEYSKKIEAWKAPVWDPTGAAFVKQYDFNFPVDIEGCSLVREYLAADELGGGTFTVKYHLHADGYEDGMYYTASADDISSFANWSAPVPVISTAAIRGGAVVNLADFEDADRAIEIAERAMASYSAERAGAFSTLRLANGSYDLIPQDDVLYYINGTDFANVTIPRVSAKRFYMAVYSGAPGAGIRINENSHFQSRSMDIGFLLTQSQIVEFRLMPGAAEYYPLGVPNRPMLCRAHKGGAVNDQIVTTGVETKITFGTEAYDVGNLWDAANSQLTGVRGKVEIKVGLGLDGGLNVGSDYFLRLRKNGTEAALMSFSPSKSSGSVSSPPLLATLDLVPTDVVTVTGAFYPPGNVTVMGEVGATWLEARVVG